jgi:hypothetical protein
MINSVRNIFGCKKLPFTAGDFASQWKNGNLDICVPITDAIKVVCKSIGYAVFVETDGLPSNDQILNNQDDIRNLRGSSHVNVHTVYLLSMFSMVSKSNW